MRSASPPLVLPRGLIFLASLWLIGSFIIAIGVRGPVHPSSASFTPGVRLMLVCLATGLMIGWPLLRLSQDRPAYPIRQTMLDLVVLLGLVQVVLWPLRLVTNWTPLRTAAIDATLAGWVLLAGAVVASAMTTDRQGPRMLAMTACIAMCLLGPALAWVGVMTGVDAMQLVDLSPLLAVRTLGDGGSVAPSDVQWRWIMLLGTADVMAWASLGLCMLLRSEPRAATADAHNQSSQDAAPSDLKAPPLHEPATERGGAPLEASDASSADAPASDAV